MHREFTSRSSSLPSRSIVRNFSRVELSFCRLSLCASASDEAAASDTASYEADLSDDAFCAASFSETPPDRSGRDVAFDSAPPAPLPFINVKIFPRTAASFFSFAFAALSFSAEPGSRRSSSRSSTRGTLFSRKRSSISALTSLKPTAIKSRIIDSTSRPT